MIWYYNCNMHVLLVELTHDLSKSSVQKRWYLTMNTLQVKLSGHSDFSLEPSPKYTLSYHLTTTPSTQSEVCNMQGTNADNGNGGRKVYVFKKGYSPGNKSMKQLV